MCLSRKNTKKALLICASLQSCKMRIDNDAKKRYNVFTTTKGRRYNERNRYYQKYYEG